MQDKVASRVKEVQEKLSKYGLPPLPLVPKVVDLGPDIAGRALLLERAVLINVHYLREHPDYILKETVAHEVCHHYVWNYFRRARQHHGPEFRRLMTFLGCTGKTYHEMRLKNGPVKARRTKYRFVYKTVRTGREVLLTKAQHTKQQNYAALAKREAGLAKLIKEMGDDMASFYTSKGEKLVYTGKFKAIK